jgi:hypothetical protein
MCSGSGDVAVKIASSEVEVCLYKNESTKMNSPLWTRQLGGQIDPCSRLFKSPTFQNFEKSAVDALSFVCPSFGQEF